jgi:L-amino acid N-acyltransferase YncA
LAERMTVNHVVEGSSPSVPVLVLIQQNEDVSLVQVQSFLKWNVAQLVGQSIYILRTVKNRGTQQQQ